MSGNFTKTILKVDTYHSPDGTVVVTPDRLRHWERQHQRLTAAKQVVPIHWDHGSSENSLVPVPLNDYKNRTRSAKNTIGRMESFKVAPDGQSAEILFATSTKDATQSVLSNLVSVSPVIYPAWKDGRGNTYRDLITHLDLVNHPVDHSQSPARSVGNIPIACSLRMSLGNGTKPIRFSLQDIKMADDENEELDKSDFGDETPAPETKLEETPNQPAIGDLMLALADHGIVLPNDTNEANFLDRLRTALIATKTQSPEPEGSMDGGFDSGDTVPMDPQIATMSSFVKKQMRSEITRKLDHLLKSGRCTPAEHAKQSADVKVLKLSLDATGEPASNSASDWISSRLSLPKGAVWSPVERLRRMGTRPTEHPQHVAPEKTPDKMSPAEIDSIAEEILAR